VGLRAQPDFYSLRLPVSPVTQVREGTVVTGQLLLGTDGGQFIRVLVESPRGEGGECPHGEGVFCFLPLHEHGDPSTVLMKQYQIGQPIADEAAMLLQDETLDPGIYPGLYKYTALQDLTLRRGARSDMELLACDATIVREKTEVRGQVLRGEDGDKHIKIVIVTPPNEGSKHAFCFLPLHVHGDPGRPLLQPNFDEKLFDGAALSSLYDLSPNNDCGPRESQFNGASLSESPPLSDSTAESRRSSCSSESLSLGTTVATEDTARDDNPVFRTVMPGVEADFDGCVTAMGQVDSTLTVAAGGVIRAGSRAEPAVPPTVVSPTLLFRNELQQTIGPQDSMTAIACSL